MFKHSCRRKFDQRLKRNEMFKLIIFCLSVTFTSSLFAQTKVWVTVEDPAAIITLKAQSYITSVDRALPASKNNELQKVYEVVTEDVTSVLEYTKNDNSLHTPQIIEEFQSLYTPNDFNSSITSDYALDLINAAEAWDLTHGEPFIHIGVLDTGFDTLHEELAGAYNDFNVSNNTNTTHGTAVAITAAGNTDNAVGKSSIGFNCKLSLRTMSYNEMLVASYAGVRVLNLSWASGCTFNPYYQSVVDEVFDNGTTIIAAAGNGPTCGGSEYLVYPASFDNVISVTSIDQNDQHQPVINDPNSTHQHNDRVDISAPGYDVALSLPGNQYVTGNGTSFAAPYVSGTVGLMLSVNPCLTPTQIENILKNTADDIYDVNPNFVGTLGAGRLNAAEAVLMAKNAHPIQTTVSLNTSSCDFNQGVFVSLDSGSVSNHSIQWSDGSDEWNRYNLTGGNYSYMITNNDGCIFFDTISFFPQGPIFDYNNSIIISDNNQELVDVNNDGIIRVKGALIIDNNITYSLNGQNFEFSENQDLNQYPYFPNSGIIVQSNSQLFVSDCDFSNVDGCANTWGGIEVLSNDLSEDGALELINSSVSNAIIGVSTFAKTNGYGDSLSGGRIYIQNCDFSNNQSSIVLDGDYNRMSTPQILNTSFINENANYSQMIKSNNVDFVLDQSYFKGAQNSSPDSRGTGVELNAASILSLDYKPNTTNSDNTFESLTTALLINNNTDAMKINDLLFTNNLTAILIQNSKNVQIANNYIVLDEGSYQYEAIGIKQTGDSYSAIASNEIEGVGNSVFSNGIIFQSQDNPLNIIRNNHFTGSMGNAISFEGDNRLEYLACNNFDVQGLSDILVEELNSTNGSLTINKELLLNDFSSCGDVITNLNMEESNFFEYQDAQSFSPNCYMGNIVVNEINIEVDRQAKCKYQMSEDIAYKFENELTQNDESLNIQNQELKDVEEYAVYPNPTNGRININTINNLKEINIYSSTGEMVKAINSEELNLTYSLNIASGVYSVVFMTTDSEIITQKLVIQ